jgi:hypothetical protein
VDDLERAVRETGAEELVLSNPLPSDELTEVRDVCARLGIPVFLAPMHEDFVAL